MDNSRTKLDKLINELTKIFNILNDHYFAGELEQPIINIQSNLGRNTVAGWCTTKKIWRDHDNNFYYEIAICAEFLYLPIDEIIGVLQHEMAHLYNIQHNIKDYSRNRYHNKRFKEAAEMAGLIATYDQKNGYNNTTQTDDAKSFIIPYIQSDIFTLTRKTHKMYGDYDSNEAINNSDNSNETTGKKKQSYRKYICPECKTIVRATKEVYIICGICKKTFILE